ncbi:MAG TPA: ribonuclease HII [Bacilli bacterium]|nr:ribonuclease HII [Bacilli bacterium]
MPLTYQDKAEFASFKHIAGIDEAGRGPWAGPVVASAVILPTGYTHPDINDSKTISEDQREQLFNIIMKDALAVGIGIIDAPTIDRTNILKATKQAMMQALVNLSVKPDFLLIDAVKLEQIDIPQQALIKGDALALPIAAASIIAKVTRDRIMREYHRHHPEYRFDLHKGYGTKRHQAELDQHGPIPDWHRFSYRPIKKYVK